MSARSDHLRALARLSNEMADRVHLDVKGPLLMFARDCDRKAKTYDWLEAPAYRSPL